MAVRIEIIFTLPSCHLLQVTALVAVRIEIHGSKIAPCAFSVTALVAVRIEIVEPQNT